MKVNMKKLRIIAGLAVLAIALIGFHFDTAIGTLCALCPVGFLQISVASGSVPWALLPGVLIVLLIVFALGRAFCSWLCPSSLLKKRLRWAYAARADGAHRRALRGSREGMQIRCRIR